MKSVHNCQNHSKYTLQGINISHLGKRKIIFKMPFLEGYVSSLVGIKNNSMVQKNVSCQISKYHEPFGSDLPSCANGLCHGQKDNWNLWCTPQRQRTCTSASAYERPNALHPWLVSNRTQQAAMQGRVRDQKMCSDANLHSRSQFLTFLCFLLREKGLTYS